MQADTKSFTHSPPVGWLKGKKNLNVVMLHVKLKGKKYRPI